MINLLHVDYFVATRETFSAVISFFLFCIMPKAIVIVSVIFIFICAHSKQPHFPNNFIVFAIWLV